MPFAEASLIALGFGFAILLIGTPIALIVLGLHDGLSSLARLGGDLSAVVAALVTVSSVAGGLLVPVCLSGWAFDQRGPLYT